MSESTVWGILNFAMGAVILYFAVPETFQTPLFGILTAGLLCVGLFLLILSMFTKEKKR